MAWHQNVVLPPFLANPENSVTAPRTRRFSIIDGTFSPASEMISSTVLTGRAEASGELFRYNFCVGAVIIEPFRIVGGAEAGALFTFMAREDVVVGSGEQSLLVLSGGILSRSIGNAW